MTAPGTPPPVKLGPFCSFPVTVDGETRRCLAVLPCEEHTPIPAPLTDRALEAFDLHEHVAACVHGGLTGHIHAAIEDFFEGPVEGVKVHTRAIADSAAEIALTALRQALSGPHGREVAEGLGMQRMQDYWAHPDQTGEHSIPLHWTWEDPPLPPGVAWLPLYALPSGEPRCDYCHDPVGDHTPSELASCRFDLEAPSTTATALKSPSSRGTRQ